MAESTGPVLLAGGLVIANEVLLAPLAGGKPPAWSSMWRLVPVTAGLAIALAGLEKLAPAFATGLAWLLVAGVILLPPGKQGSVITNANKILKY